MTEEIFPNEQVKSAYEAFPADLSKGDWEKRLRMLIIKVDHYCGFEDSATARKARDVVIYTLTDERVPALLAALVQAQPLLDAMHKQVQSNITRGIDPQDNFRANKWLSDLSRAMKGMQQ